MQVRPVRPCHTGTALRILLAPHLLLCCAASGRLGHSGLAKCWHVSDIAARPYRRSHRPYRVEASYTRGLSLVADRLRGVYDAGTRASVRRPRHLARCVPLKTGSKWSWWKAHLHCAAEVHHTGSVGDGHRGVCHRSGENDLGFPSACELEQWVEPGLEGGKGQMAFGVPSDSSVSIARRHLRGV